MIYFWIFHWPCWSLSIPPFPPPPNPVKTDKMQKIHHPNSHSLSHRSEKCMQWGSITETNPNSNHLKGHTVASILSAVSTSCESPNNMWIWIRPTFTGQVREAARCRPRAISKEMMIAWPSEQSQRCASICLTLLGALL